ncbi:MAG: DUF5320 domain-containing protein [Candidatus Thermoplasmatota archaeon]
MPCGDGTGPWWLYHRGWRGIGPHMYRHSSVYRSWLQDIDLSSISKNERKQILEDERRMIEQEKQRIEQLLKDIDSKEE